MWLRHTCDTEAEKEATALESCLEPSTTERFASMNLSIESIFIRLVQDFDTRLITCVKLHYLHLCKVR
jgi:hypothetical protein